MTNFKSVDLATNDIGRDAWGRPKVINDESLFHGMFTYNVPVSVWKEELNGVEIPLNNATSIDGKLSILAGATLSDETRLTSYRNLRYQPNRGHLYSTAGFIINPTASMERDFGTFTTDSGVFFRVKSTGMYAVIATTLNGVYVENETVIDTTGIDLSKGNTYDIQFEWRGVGNYKFFINLVEVLSVDFLGTQVELSMFNPSNPVCFRSTNLGANDAMQFGCVDITTEGGTQPKGEYGSVSVSNESGQVSMTGFNVPALAIRSKLLVGTLVNTRDTLALLASAYSDQKSFLRVWVTRDFTAITPNNQTWTDYGDGHLEYIVYDDPDVATPMTFDTVKAQPVVFGGRVGMDTTYSTSALFEGRSNIYITPGDMFVFTLHRENAGVMLGGVTFEFAEEI
jgi:hypothetical protein